jgi:hypothetical protein
MNVCGCPPDVADEGGPLMPRNDTQSTRNCWAALDQDALGVTDAVRHESCHTILFMEDASFAHLVNLERLGVLV